MKWLNTFETTSDKIAILIDSIEKIFLITNFIIFTIKKISHTLNK